MPDSTRRQWDLTIPVHDDTEVEAYVEPNGDAEIDVAEIFGVITVGAYGVGPRLHLDLTLAQLDALARKVAQVRDGVREATKDRACRRESHDGDPWRSSPVNP